MTVSSCPSSFLVTSFLILSLLLLLFIRLSQFISIASNFLSSSFLRHQHSEPYNSTGITKVSYSFSLVLVDIFLSLQILPNLPNSVHARVLLRLMSLVHLASSVISPPRYTNSVTCSSSSPPNVTSNISCLFPTTIVLVFCTLIFSPSLLLLQSTLLVSSCSCILVSATRSIIISEP